MRVMLRGALTNREWIKLVLPRTEVPPSPTLLLRCSILETQDGWNRHQGCICLLIKISLSKTSRKAWLLAMCHFLLDAVRVEHAVRC